MSKEELNENATTVVEETKEATVTNNNGGDTSTNDTKVSTNDTKVLSENEIKLQQQIDEGNEKYKTLLTKFDEMLKKTNDDNEVIKNLTSFKDEMKNNLMVDFTDEQKESFKDLNYNQLSEISKLNKTKKNSQGIERPIKKVDVKSEQEIAMKEYLRKANSGVYDNALYNKAFPNL